MHSFLSRLNFILSLLSLSLALTSSPASALTRGEEICRAPVCAPSAGVACGPGKTCRRDDQTQRKIYDICRTGGDDRQRCLSDEDVTCLNNPACRGTRIYTRAEEICERQSCATKTCPTGFTCRQDETTKGHIQQRCRVNGAERQRCLSDEDVTCLRDRNCWDSRTRTQPPPPTTTGTTKQTQRLRYHEICERTNCAGGQSQCPEGSNTICRQDDAVAAHVRDLCGFRGPRSFLCLTDTEAECIRTVECRSQPIFQPTEGEDNSTGAAFAPITPKLNVQIPGLELGSTVKEGDDIVVPFLAQYIAGVYRYLIVLSLIAAVIMVVVGGFRYLVGASIGDVKTGQKIVQDAVVGLLLVLGAYTILYVINPELLQLRPLRIPTIRRDNSWQLIWEEFGTAGPDDAGPPADVSDGGFRKAISAACGYNAMSLPLAQRVERLKHILRIFKSVAVDQGGSLYIRGGFGRCEINPARLLNDGGWVGHTKSMLNSEARSRKVINYSFSSNCQKLLEERPDQDRSIAKLKTKDERKQALGNLYSSCKTEIGENFRRFGQFGDQGGYFCGDCIMTVKWLMYCLGGQSLSGRVMSIGRSCSQPTTSKGQTVYHDDLSPHGKLRFSAYGRNFNTDQAAIAALRTLQFGDVITFSKPGHAILYTGPRHQTGLDFEIVEMGCVGWDLPGNRSGGRVRDRRTGFSGDGVCVSPSAEEYFKRLLSNDNCVRVQKRVFDDDWGG